MYSDASVEPGQQPRLGWILLQDSGQLCAARILDVDSHTLKEWIPRKQQIFAAETFCFPAAIIDQPGFFCDADVIWFADNEATASSIIRGASCPEDVHGLAEVTFAMVAALRCRLWVEWVDSASNPSDGLSREGLQNARFGALAQRARPDLRHGSRQSIALLSVLTLSSDLQGSDTGS